MRKVYIYVYRKEVKAFSNVMEAYKYYSSIDIKKVSYVYFLRILNKNSQFLASKGIFYKRIVNN